MILAHSLLCGNVSEHVSLLLIGSSHAHWTRAVPLRCTIFDFFSNLLVLPSYEIASAAEESRMASYTKGGTDHGETNLAECG